MQILEMNSKNIYTHDLCLVKDPKNPGFIAKSQWLEEQFKNGLVIKRAMDREGKLVNFIEATPIEHCFRAVEGSNLLFIHCVFTYPTKNKNLGFMTGVIEDLINHAKSKGFGGIAVLTSKSAFMADRRIFEKSGFQVCDKKSEYELLFYEITPSTEPPKIKNFDEKLSVLKGLHIYYTDQCPALMKPVTEIQKTCEEKNIPVTVHHIKTAHEAQNAPFPCGTFAIILNGKILAERCISHTRFLNLAKKHGLICEA